MEEVLPPQTQNAAGFEPTTVRQFTVFLENRVGRLQQMVRVYEENGGRIAALSIQDTADIALVRLICCDSDLAKDVLEKDRFSFIEHGVLVVQALKRPALLTSICSVLLAAEINIHYAYPLLLSPPGPGLILYLDDSVLGAQLLIKKGFNLIGESDLRKAR